MRAHALTISRRVNDLTGAVADLGVMVPLAAALDPSLGLTWIDPDPADVVLLAHATGLTAYDASYVCAAAMTGAELLTADKHLAAAVDPFVDRSGP